MRAYWRLQKSRPQPWTSRLQTPVGWFAPKPVASQHFKESVFHLGVPKFGTIRQAAKTVGAPWRLEGFYCSGFYKNSKDKSCKGALQSLRSRWDLTTLALWWGSSVTNCQWELLEPCPQPVESLPCGWVVFRTWDKKANWWSWNFWALCWMGLELNSDQTFRTRCYPYPHVGEDFTTQAVPLEALSGS